MTPAAADTRKMRPWPFLDRHMRRGQHQYQRLPWRQRGATLLLGMLLMAVLCLAVTSAFSDNQWQLRISANQANEARAVQAASSALRWGEDWLMNLAGTTRPTPCSSSCGADQPVLADGMVPATPTGLGEIWWLDRAHGDGREPVSAAHLADRRISGTPGGRWIIQELHHAPADLAAGRPAISYYRVVARAARVPRGTPIVLESIVARPWGAPQWTDALPRPPARFCDAADAPAHCGRLSWRRLQ